MAAGAFREAHARQRDVALEHAGEAVASFPATAADGDGAGDVRGAVLILAAAIDQEQRAARQAPIGALGDAVMHDGAVRTRARDGVEREVAVSVPVPARNSSSFWQASIS